MLTDNNQIFRNWFIIIHRHLIKVSVQIIQCMILERNKLSITIYDQMRAPAIRNHKLDLAIGYDIYFSINARKIALYHDEPQHRSKLK